MPACERDVSYPVHAMNLQVIASNGLATKNPIPSLAKIALESMQINLDLNPGIIASSKHDVSHRLFPGRRLETASGQYVI